MKPIGDWKVKEHIDPKTGIASRRYTYKNKSCKRKVIDTNYGRQLAGYCLIEKDLRNCIAWLSEIERLYASSGENKERGFAISGNREIFNVIKALYVAMITFYGKCFAGCEGRRVKLERSKIEEKYRELHDHCIRHRNNYTAHSGAEKIETCQIVLVYPSKVARNKPVKTNLFTEIAQPDAMLVDKGEQQEVDLMGLFEHVKTQVERKIKLLTEKIYEEEITNKPEGIYR